MKLNRKLVLILSLVLSLALATGGTLAYLSDTDADVNTMTLGNVYIVQNEQERDADGKLVEFTQNKPVYPAVYEGTSIDYADPADWVVPNDEAWKVVKDNENVLDKFITVTNTGKSDAYVRTYIAFEVGEEAANDAYMHMVVNSDPWAGEWLKDDNGNEIVITVDGNTYKVYQMTYKNVLPAGETTVPSLKQIYLDKAADNKVVEAYGEDFSIIALSQAVQTAGFADAATALDTAFPMGDDRAETLVNWFKGAKADIGSPSAKPLPDGNIDNNPPVKYTGDPAKLAKLLTEAAAAGSGDATIELEESYDMTGIDWTPIKVDGYHGAGVVTVEGNGNIIKGLNAPLFAGGFAGKSGIVIKDLTIADSDMVSNHSTGSGVFIENADSMEVITLENCHVKNCTLTATKESRAGGLIGWVSGYAKQDDGPVKSYVTIKNCSVVNTEISTFGSVGGIVGHAGASDWTWVTIEDCTVTGCELTSTDDGGWRVGVAVGTANNGHVVINNITESDNTLAQTGKTAPVGQSNLYGRFVPSGTGTLVIDGVEIK